MNLNYELITEIEDIAKERYELQQRDDELKEIMLCKLKSLLKTCTCPHCGAAYADDTVWLRYDEFGDWQLQCTHYPCDFQTPRLGSLLEMMKYIEFVREYFNSNDAKEV